MPLRPDDFSYIQAMSGDSGISRLKSSPVRQFLATLLLALFVIFYWLSQVGPVKHIPLPMAKTTYGHIIFTNKTGIGEILEERGTNTLPTAIREDHAEMPSSFSEELRKLLPSAFDEIPSEFLPEYKNPCYNGSDNQFHCLPYFFILGNPKCGTTEIWRKLIEHPAINHRNKERHWWTRYGPRGIQTLERYETKAFTSMIEGKPNASNIITGEASASTFWENSLWEKLYPDFYDIGPPYVIADVVRALLPKSKLIVSLRDPTARVYSDYTYFRRRTGSELSPENFHRFVSEEIEKFRDCNSSRSERACVYSGNSDEKVRIRVGIYSVYMHDWLRAFPRNQLYVIKLEEFSLKCKTILAELYDFLDIAQLPGSRIEEICNSQRANVNEKSKRIGPMMNATKEMVRNFYRPYVVALASILKDKRFMWDY